MSRDGSVEIEIDGSVYRFRYGMRQHEEIDRLFQCGLSHLHNLISTEVANKKRIAEVFRVGLIGGGASREKALSLTNQLVWNEPDWKTKEPALRILEYAVAGPEDDLPKLAGEESSRSHPSQTDGSALPASSAMAS